MRLRQTLKQHPELALCTIAMVLLGVLGAALVLHFAGQQHALQLDRYGQALADRAAEQAVEPALAQDMISLQVIVQSVTTQPAVLRASIRDVENRLLVEHGESTAPVGYQTPSYSAGITLDTHIAGHLSVTLQTPPTSQLYGLFLWVWSIAILLCIAGLWLTQHILQQRRDTIREEQTLSAAAPATKAHPSEPTAPVTQPDPTHEEVTNQPSDDDESPEDDEQPSPKPDANQEGPSEPDTHWSEAEKEHEAPQHAVIIELVFLNIDTLRLQLTLGRFNHRLERLDQALSGILALYAGTKGPLRNQRMKLTVTGDSLADASFYALCICQLALRLSLSGERPVLKLAANVMATDTQAKPPAHTTPAVWVDPALQCDLLEQHVQINAADHLEQIKPPYESLLQRQEQQLASLATSDA